MTEFRIGAYLEIDCNKGLMPEQHSGCENGHDRYGQFCSICGLPNRIGVRVVERYPRHIVDDILLEEYEDAMQDITPQRLFGSGKILATDNGIGVGVYSILDDEAEESVTAVPTPGEIEQLTREFRKGYQDIITALEASPLVKSAVVKFGIVREEEY